MKTAKPRPCPKKKLPNKPSALIKLALADLAVVERRKGYVIDMGAYHMPVRAHDAEPKCLVCLAGCVIVNTLRMPPNKDFVPDFYGNPFQFSKTTDRKLLALDKFRCGYVGEGLEILGVSEHDRQQLPVVVDVAGYDEDRKQFRKDLRNLIKLLEKHGL